MNGSFYSANLALTALRQNIRSRLAFVSRRISFSGLTVSLGILSTSCPSTYSTSTGWDR